jgi:hypothetical protein
MYMIIELLRWWYGAGWFAQVKRIQIRSANVAHAFSAGALLKTLFAPWRRIQFDGGRGLDAKLQAAVDNFVSRVVGFTSRFIVLLAALTMVAGTILLSVSIVIVWPLIPLAVLAGVVKGFV